MSIKINQEHMRGAAAIGVAGAIFVTAGSLIANAYTAARHAADAVGGWEFLGIEGGLNVALNGGLAIGSEVLGLVALGFVLHFAKARAWDKLAATIVVGGIAIWFNMTNSEEFVLRQASSTAESRAKASPEYKGAAQDAARSDVAKKSAENLPANDPAAIAREIEGLGADLDKAREDGRWRDARDLKDQVAAARGRKTAAESRIAAIAEAQRQGDDARRRMAALLAKAEPEPGSQARADLIKWAVEIIKALGLAAFTLESEAVAQTVAPRPPQPQPAGFHAQPITYRPPVKRKAAQRAESRLSIEEKRRRQRLYTARWRAARAGLPVPALT